MLEGGAGKEDGFGGIDEGFEAARLIAKDSLVARRTARREVGGFDGEGAGAEDGFDAVRGVNFGASGFEELEPAFFFVLG
jgi:hypothetical protein